MKKILALMFCLILGMTFLSGCGDNATAQGLEGADWEPTTIETANNTEEVTLTIKEGFVSASGITVIFQNNSDKQYLYGEYMWLEKRVNDEWKQVPAVIENYGFQDIAYILEPNESKEMQIDWEWLHGALGSGDYRFIKDVFPAEAEEYNPYYLAVEFTIE